MFAVPDAPKHFLPGVLLLIADEIGEDTAIKLAQARGGRDVFVPAEPKPDHVISTIIGHSAALKLSKLVGAGDLLVPTGNIVGNNRRRNSEIRKLWKEGASISEIAAQFDMHKRSVQRVVNKVQNDAQATLPFIFDSQ